MTLIPKTTNAGTPYSVVSVPSRVTYTYFSSQDCGLVDGENRYWTIYIPMSEVREKCFPLNANPRKPNSIGSNESTDIVVKMRRTISNDPEKFVRLNNGLTCVCSSLSINSSSQTLTVDWREGEGILNGGHTYLSLVTNPTVTDAIVRVEIIELSERFNDPSNSSEKQDFIKETAIARNSNRQLKDFTRSEFEGKHQLLQNHLLDLKGVIYWSEGYEEMVREPLAFTERNAMKAAVFVRYLALTDNSWHWHPSDNNDPADSEILNNLLVQGNGTYDQWNLVALDEEHEKNLVKVAPLGRMLLALVDRIRASMKYETNPDGSTANPVGCGSSFITTEFFQNWAGSGQGREVSYHDKGSNELPKSSPHFVAYMINSIRPFLWYGDTDEGFEFVGWHLDPLSVYDEIHKAIVQEITPQYIRHRSGRDLASNNMVASSVWRNIVRPYWAENCSLDCAVDNFYPQVFFDPSSEKWYQRDNSGTWMLSYVDSDEEWTLNELAPGSSPTGYSRMYVKLEENPY